MKGVGAANNCTAQAVQCIRDDVLFTGQILNIKPELLKELGRLDKTEVYCHGGRC